MKKLVIDKKMERSYNTHVSVDPGRRSRATGHTEGAGLAVPIGWCSSVGRAADS